MQIAAMDLYRRGLNVFPVCRPEEVKELARLYPNKINNTMKLPYILRPLFYYRLHLCNIKCSDRQNKLGHPCSGSRPWIRFEDLFDFANLGVMLGRTSGNLVCVDCDSQIAFEQSLREFTKRGQKFWGYYTSRGGNLLFRIKEGELANKKHCSISGVEIWGNNHFCVLPPSVHSCGVIYSWLDRTEPLWYLPANEPPPLLSIGQVDWLGVQLKKGQTHSKCFESLPCWTKALSENTCRILTSQHREGERNIKLTKAVYDVAAAIQLDIVGYKEAENLLHQTAARCVPPYPSAHITEMLRTALNKPGLKLSRQYFERKPSITFGHATILKAEKFVKEYDWRIHGRTAQTDRVVFLACIQRAKLDREEDFRASQREILDLANIQQRVTVRNAIKRLVKHELLAFTKVDQGGSNRYKFSEKIIIGNYPINPLLINGGVDTDTVEIVHGLPSRPIEQDIFLKLGKVAWVVYQYLLNKPESSPSRIAKATHQAQSSVSEALKKMLEIGLLTYSQAEGVYLGEHLSIETFEAIAERLGVLGKSYQRKVSINLDREINVNRQIAQARKKFAYLRKTKPNGAIMGV